MAGQLRREAFRFGAAGTIGFFVDAAVLYFTIYVLGAGPKWGRLLSYLVAATTTWAINRKYTFDNCESSSLWRQWAQFLAMNALGGVVNYTVYFGIVTLHSSSVFAPLIGVGMGSLVGLIFNFILAKRLVFRVQA